jgi:hypothetical protein
MIDIVGYDEKDEMDFAESLRKMNTNQWNSPPPPMIFINPKLGFELNPDHFIEWLKMENQEVVGDYETDCAGMCEYSCLYISMLLSETKLKGKLKIIAGNFGFWEHYWMSYTLNEVEYFIDLTLQQFVPDSPKCSISLSEGEVDNGYRNFFYMDVKEYLEEKKAFSYYMNPNDI